VAVGHRDVLNVAEMDAHIFAIAEKHGALRAGVEQHASAATAIFNRQAQAEAEIGEEKRLAGDFLGAAFDDICELGNGEDRLGDVGVADIVGDDIDGEGIN
jgi:hypothetical protein